MGHPSASPARSRQTPRSPATAATLRSAVSPVVQRLERLESRQLLSVSFDDGVLQITGTDAADDVQLRFGKPGVLRINDNGDRHYFKIAEIEQIRFDGKAGDDVFNLQEVGGTLKVSIVAHGGEGDDTLTGGAGDDSLFGGAGDDVLFAKGGKNLLVGGAGDDNLIAGKDADRLFGRAGNDTLSDGSDNGDAKDTTVGGAGDDQINTIRNAFPIIDSFTNVPAGYSVNQMRNAYGFTSVRGNNPWTGEGTAIAIVGAYSLPTARQDLDTFADEMGLPGLGRKKLQIVNMAPKNRQLFAEDWNGEAMLDLQWAHAIAPGAKIYMIQAATNSGPDLFAAVRRAIRVLNARHKGGVVSMSWGSLFDEEFDRSFNSVFTGPNTRDVSFVVSSGDTGGAGWFPGLSPNVTSVGGTALYLDEYGNRVPGTTPSVVVEETGTEVDFVNLLGTWSGDVDCGATLSVPGGEKAWWVGSGGFSNVFDIPQYQENRGIPSTTRGIPDVSWNGDPATGVSVYNSAGGGGNAGWQTVGGTSAGAPQFAGLVAVVNQLRRQNGKRVIGNRLNNAIYRLGGTGPDAYFNDITVHGSGLLPGTNCPQPGFAQPAGIGWDPATGWGTPNAQSLIPALADDRVISGRRPTGGVPIVRSNDIRVQGIFSADDPFAGNDVLSFNGTTNAAGAGTITVDAMTTTRIIRTGGGTAQGFITIVDIFGQDEAAGTPFTNGWELFILNGQLVRQQLNQGTGTPITLVRNGDRVSGYFFAAVTDITVTVDPNGGQTDPTPVDLGDANSRVSAVRFEGKVSKSGKISGDFYSVDFEGNRLKRDFRNNTGTFLFNGSFND